MKNYGLNFISSEKIYEHVKETVHKYSAEINLDLKGFNSNIIDPVKLTFDSKVYHTAIEEVIEREMLRQIDKSNNNHIGYFHQNIFKYIDDGWKVPEQGFDVINEAQSIFVEIKNKHNTMNSASSQKTYMKMQNKILENDQATCLLVEVIAKKSQNIKWSVSLDGNSMAHEKIRRVSMDKFYGMVTGESDAFMNLCSALPKIIDDVVGETSFGGGDNTVMSELKKVSPDILQSLYLLAFKEYEGFDGFSIHG